MEKKRRKTADSAVTEFRNLFVQFQTFLRENKLVPWVAAASVLFSYGLFLSGGVRIGIDAEANLNNSAEFLNSWYSIGRFSLVFTKNLLGMRELNPVTANLIAMCVMVLYGIFADFLFYLFSGKNSRMKIFYFIFPALFLTHPCYVQQYIFTVQALEVALGVLSCLGAVFCLAEWAFEGKRDFFPVGLLLMVWGFGSYQALIPFYMSVALSVYLVRYYFSEEEEPHFYLHAALRFFLSFAAGYLLYQMAVKGVIIWQEGPGFQGDYLEGQLIWSLSPFLTCIGHIKHYIRMVLLGESVFYPKTFFLFAILFAVHLLYNWVKKRRREYIFYAAAALALVLSPFYLTIYQGGGILMRTQMSLPFAAAFFGAAAASWICAGRRYLAAIAVGLGFFCAVRQSSISSRALFSAYMAYENDKITAQQILIRMQELGTSEEGQKVAMIGRFSPDLPDTYIREETVGSSFFDWDYMSPTGTTKRGAGFMESLGFPLEPVSPQEYAQMKEYAKIMPSWPENGSVQLAGDVVVIKFSE